jgi:hypothetical protein
MGDTYPTKLVSTCLVMGPQVPLVPELERHEGHDYTQVTLW